MPESIKVVKELCCGLTESAIEAAKKMRFRPGMVNGEPVAVRIPSVQFDFRL